MKFTIIVVVVAIIIMIFLGFYEVRKWTKMMVANVDKSQMEIEDRLRDMVDTKFLGMEKRANLEMNLKADGPLAEVCEAPDYEQPVEKQSAWNAVDDDRLEMLPAALLEQLHVEESGLDNAILPTVEDTVEEEEKLLETIEEEQVEEQAEKPAETIVAETTVARPRRGRPRRTP